MKRKLSAHRSKERPREQSLGKTLCKKTIANIYYTQVSAALLFGVALLLPTVIKGRDQAINFKYGLGLFFLRQFFYYAAALAFSTLLFLTHFLNSMLGTILKRCLIRSVAYNH